MVSIASTVAWLGPEASRAVGLFEATLLWDFITASPGANGYPPFLLGFPGQAKEDPVEGKVGVQLSHDVLRSLLR